MPVVSPLPRATAVYAPGTSVARMADSASLVGGMVVAWISASWVSRQLSLLSTLPLESWTSKGRVGQRSLDATNRNGGGRRVG